MSWSAVRSQTWGWIALHQDAAAVGAEDQVAGSTAELDEVIADCLASCGVLKLQRLLSLDQQTEAIDAVSPATIRPSCATPRPMVRSRATSQRRTEPSTLPVRIRVPSTLIATAGAVVCCLSGVPTASPVAVSQTMLARVSPPLTNRVPSELKDTPTLRRRGRWARSFVRPLRHARV